MRRQEELGRTRHEVFEAKDVEDTREVLAERHQAPFTADLVEAAEEEVLVVNSELNIVASDSLTVLHQ